MSKIYGDISESVWNDMRKRSLGGEVKAEDDVNALDIEGLYEYIKSHYKFNDDCIHKFTFGKTYINIPLFENPHIHRHILFNVFEYRCELYEVVFEKWPTSLQNVLKEKYNVETVKNDLGDIMTYITPKDGNGDNAFLLDFIETIISNVEQPLLRSITNESVWNDMRKRSLGNDIKAEDDVNHFDINEFYAYIKELYKTKVEYIDLDAMGDGNVLGVDITKDIILFYKPKRGHILLSWSRLKIPMSFFDKLADRFKVESPNAMRRIITEKDGSCTNKTFVDVIDFFLEHKQTLLNESVWNDMRKRSLGQEEKNEDAVAEMDLKDLEEYISDYANEVVYEYGRTVGDGTLDVFIDYLKNEKKVNDGVIIYVKNNWTETVCDMVNGALEEAELEHKQDMNESVWNDMRKRSLGDTVKKEDDVTYSSLEDEDCTIEMLYNYLIQNYKPLGDEQISLNSGKYRGIDWHEVHVPITLDGENIETELEADDCTKIWSIDFTLNLMEYVEKMNTVEEIDDVNLGSDTYARAYTGSSPLLCSSVVDFLDEILSLVPNPALKKKTLVKESVWNDMRKRSLGDEVKKEDEVLSDMEINSLNQFTLMYCRGERAKYIMNKIVPPPPSKRKENDYDGLIKYIEDRRDENRFTNVGDYNKIIGFIKKNWDKLDMDKYIKKYIFSPDMMKGTKIVECEGVPGGLTPADVGGMGAITLPGEDGTPGSGDLPSPTGIVYHQVAPFGLFIKDLKKKKKKKKFRKEDEPCVHSPNTKVYDYVDDYREYVDRTYNNIDRRK